MSQLDAETPNTLLNQTANGRLAARYPPSRCAPRLESQCRRKKHGVGFKEARSVFADERAKLIDDPDHFDEEDRFILLGLSALLRVLVVCHCYREEGNVIRIISARKATTKESK